MKIRNYQHLAFIAFVLTVCMLFSSCHNTPSQKTDIVVDHPFTACNWSYEQQVLDFDFDIVDTTRPYRIEFVLSYDTTLNELTEVPVNVTIIAPDGMESFVSSTLNFDPNVNKYITPSDQPNVMNMRLIAFNNRKFNQPGMYSIEFYRKTAKADNYGMNNLSLKVIPLKRNSKK